MPDEDKDLYIGKTVLLDTKRDYTGWKGVVIRKSKSSSAFRQYAVEVKKPHGSVTVYADPGEMTIVED